MSARSALICDDDRMIVRISRSILTQAGFRVLEAADGIAGLAMIRAERPHLVLLDLNMPLMGGVAVLTELQKEGFTGSYIIVLSGDDQASLERQVKGLGAGEAISKPFAAMDFSRKIQALVRDGKV